MKEDVFDLGGWVICKWGTFYTSFRRCGNASAKGLELKEPSNNNLPNQTIDVIINPINPVNPDSKP